MPHDLTDDKITLVQTRTTRTPHDYPYHWVILDPKSKEDKVKVTNLKNSPKFLLKLLDKMCKYEMDPMSIVEDTERTRFCPQTDRRTDRRTRWYQYTPLSTSLKRGFNYGLMPSSHWLNQSWPRSVSPYSVTGPQWVNVIRYVSISVTNSLLIQNRWRYASFNFKL